MKYTLLHHNHFVLDLESNMKFYEEAFGLVEQRRMICDNGGRIIVFMGNDNAEMQVVLQWDCTRKASYNHGADRSHIAIHVDNVEESFKKHTEMGIVISEMKNKFYFVADPEGYRIEVLDESL